MTNIKSNGQKTKNRWALLRIYTNCTARPGTHWQEKDFWKGYYWDGGIVYKHRLVRYKNGMLRFRFGPQFGAVQKRFFIGLEGGFEYSYVFRNGWEFALIQKNNVNFLHGDTFRNGLLLGMKIPF